MGAREFPWRPGADVFFVGKGQEGCCFEHLPGFQDCRQFHRFKSSSFVFCLKMFLEAPGRVAIKSKSTRKIAHGTHAGTAWARDAGVRAGRSCASGRRRYVQSSYYFFRFRFLQIKATQKPTGSLSLTFRNFAEVATDVAGAQVFLGFSHSSQTALLYCRFLNGCTWFDV